MKKRILALIFFFMISICHGAILTKNTQGYVFQLLEFNTDKSQYLINDTLSIYTKWNRYFGEYEEGFLRFEITTCQGICLYQSESYNENGFEIEKTHLIELITLNIVPQSIPLTLEVKLHFYVRDTISGEQYESYASRSIQVNFFNLTYSCFFTNLTKIYFSDPIQLIINLWERDLNHFSASNLNLSTCIKNEQDQTIFESVFLTDTQGTGNLSLMTASFSPNKYTLKITSNSSMIFNPLELIRDFVVFPGNLTVFIGLDPPEAVVSIPEENIFRENSLSLDVWYKNGCLFFPELQFNWTLLNLKGIFHYLGNHSFHSILSPIKESGEYIVEIIGSSSYFENIRISHKIMILKRELVTTITLDDQKKALSLKVSDKATNTPLPISLLGEINFYETDQKGSYRRITYEIHNNIFFLSPSFIAEDFEGYQILIEIGESKYFSYYSKITSIEELIPNLSNTSVPPLFNIILMISLPGVIILYFRSIRNRKKKGFLLKDLKFEI